MTLYNTFLRTKTRLVNELSGIPVFALTRRL